MLYRSPDKALNYRVASIFGCAERAEKTALFDRDVGKGTLFEIVFGDPEDQSKKVTVFWYTEMDGTGIKDSVDYSDDEMAVVLSVDSEDVYLVDIVGKISSPVVYNTSVMVTAGEEPQYLVESNQQIHKDEIRIGYQPSTH